MNWGPLFQSFGDVGTSIARARLGAADYRMKQLLDQLGIKREKTEEGRREEELKRLKAQPTTDEEALNQKFTAYENILKRKLSDQEKQILIGIPWQAQRNPVEQKIADTEKALGRKLTDNERNIIAGIETKPSEKQIKVNTTKSGEPYEIVDEDNKSYRVSDPNMPQKLKDFLADWRAENTKGEERIAKLQATKDAEAINKAIKLGDIREANKARDEFRKNVVMRGINGHGFVKTVSQEVAAAQLTGGKGTRSGDLLIAEGYMQLMFGFAPKALRGAPNQVKFILEKQGGWDQRAIAEINGALNGGILSQDVREQMLEAVQRQVETWDYQVTTTSQMTDDPKVKAMAQKYIEVTAKGDEDDISAGGGKPH